MLQSQGGGHQPRSRFHHSSTSHTHARRCTQTHPSPRSHKVEYEVRYFEKNEMPRRGDLGGVAVIGAANAEKRAALCAVGGGEVLKQTLVHRRLVDTLGENLQSIEGLPPVEVNIESSLRCDRARSHSKDLTTFRECPNVVGAKGPVVEDVGFKNVFNENPGGYGVRVR